MNLAKGVVLGVLAGLSAYDLKRKKIVVPVVIISGVVAVIYRLCCGTGILDLLAGIVPGVLLLFVSYCTKESIGMGDGMVLCALGVFCGCRMTFAILGMALVLAALLAIVLLVLRRAGRKTELPFVPCLCAAYFLCLFL